MSLVDRLGGKEKGRHVVVVDIYLYCMRFGYSTQGLGAIIDGLVEHSKRETERSRSTNTGELSMIQHI
jgi:hypothetical protein